MKLQNLAIIFILLIIPIAMVMGLYVRGQAQTLTMQTKYDKALSSSTYDAVSAYRINTKDNELVDNADSIREDIQAATNTFMMSMGSSLNMSKDDIKPYVPAMLYTLYDGYYIYSAVKSDSGIEYTLKPYIYYSEHIQGEDASGKQVNIVINYTLDNYIAIYGQIGDKYIAKSGYLIDLNKTNTDGTIYKNETLTATIEKESLSENVVIRTTIDDTTNEYNYELLNLPYRYVDQKKVYYLGDSIDYYKDGDKQYTSGWYTYSSTRGELIEYTEKTLGTNDDDKLDDSAIQYYKDAYEFTKFLRNDCGIDDITKSGNLDLDFLKINDANDPEDYNSAFCQHKRKVIKESIESNLKNAISTFSAMSQAGGTTYNYKMPILLEEDWEKIFTEVTMTTFFQGLPIGFKTYNNYSMISVTGNKQFVNPELLYFIDANSDSTDKENGEYHKITCGKEGLTTVKGYRSIDFEQYKIQVTNPNASLADETKADYKYYYKHSQTGDYNCIVQDKTDFAVYENGYFSDKLIGTNLKSEISTAYFTTLARERYNQYKATGYLNQEFEIGEEPNIDIVDENYLNYELIIQNVDENGIQLTSYKYEFNDKVKNNTVEEVIGEKRYNRNIGINGEETHEYEITSIEQQNNEYYSFNNLKVTVKITGNNDNKSFNVVVDSGNKKDKYNNDIVRYYEDTTGMKHTITVKIYNTPKTKYNFIIRNVDKDDNILESYNYNIKAPKDGKGNVITTNQNKKLGSITDTFVFENENEHEFKITPDIQQNNAYRNIDTGTITVNIKDNGTEELSNGRKVGKAELQSGWGPVHNRDLFGEQIVNVKSEETTSMLGTKTTTITVTITNTPKTYVTTGKINVAAIIKEKLNITLRADLEGIKGDFTVAAFIKENGNTEGDRVLQNQTANENSIKIENLTSADWYTKEWQIKILDWDGKIITGSTVGVTNAAKDNIITALIDKVNHYEIEDAGGVRGLSGATNEGAISKRDTNTTKYNISTSIGTLTRDYGDANKQRTFIVTQDIQNVGRIRPIANFKGIFEGQNNTIRNVTINQNSNNDKQKFGLFASNKGTIQNVNINNITITVPSITNSYRVGGLVGYNTGMLKNITVEKSRITDSYNNAQNLTGDFEKSIGGIVGESTKELDELKIEELSINARGINMVCTTNSIPDLSIYVGGIVGKTSTKISNSNVSKYTFTSNNETLKLDISALNREADIWAVINIDRKLGIGGIVGYSTSYIENSNVNNTTSLTNSLKMTNIDLNSIFQSRIGDDINSTGGIVGIIEADSLNISSCNVENTTIRGVENIGGAIGYISGNQNVNIKSLNVNNSTISGERSVGGIVGKINNNMNLSATTSKVENSNVSGDENIGGIVGYNVEGAITGFTNNATIQGKRNTGGIVGYNHAGYIVNCHNGGKIIGTSNEVNENDTNGNKIEDNTGTGGIVGFNNGSAKEVIRKKTGGTIENCHNSGEINCNANGGGIVGVNYDSTDTNNAAFITACYNIGSISNNNYEYKKCNRLGGIAGVNAGGEIKYCYNLADIKGRDKASSLIDFGSVGGICGQSYREGSTISYCYNTGNISGNWNTPIMGALSDTNGAILGYSRLVTNVVKNCYYLEGTATSNRRGGESFNSDDLKYRLKEWGESTINDFKWYKNSDDTSLGYNGRGILYWQDASGYTSAYYKDQLIFSSIGNNTSGTIEIKEAGIYEVAVTAGGGGGSKERYRRGLTTDTYTYGGQGGASSGAYLGQVMLSAGVYAYEIGTGGRGDKNVANSGSNTIVKRNSDNNTIFEVKGASGGNGTIISVEGGKKPTNIIGKISNTVWSAGNNSKDNYRNKENSGGISKLQGKNINYKDENGTQRSIQLNDFGAGGGWKQNGKNGCLIIVYKGNN